MSKSPRKPMSEEESLRRSHSKLSNFRLTLICLLCALALCVLVAALATIGTELLPPGVVAAAIVVAGLLTAFSLWRLSRFHR